MKVKAKRNHKEHGEKHEEHKVNLCKIRSIRVICVPRAKSEIQKQSLHIELR
jgi:hypothetical protein